MGSWAGTHAAHVFTAQVFGDYLLITSININALLWNSGVHVHPARHFEHLSISKRQSAAHRFPMFWSSYLTKYQSRFFKLQCKFLLSLPQCLWFFNLVYSFSNPPYRCPQISPPDTFLSPPSHRPRAPVSVHPAEWETKPNEPENDEWSWWNEG